ncbi:hypothetical protein [Agromyces seonyuensis]|uniref:Helicase n=1 Tax=Agromyces seonyuensis TaxID=2662446 RepID=A0A6I4NZE5_9MICO|nr:hypothetical protein [Agromyces seonyuensis]MWB99693.1 hypothetical protein [Agromyces seonyuensis]
MPEHPEPHDRAVLLGGLTRAELAQRLAEAGVLLNAHAETLLDDLDLEDGTVRSIRVVERTVAELGLPDGAPLSRVFSAAERSGLRLCPPETAPFLRLQTLGQAASTDSVLSAGRAPEGSLTVAAAPLRADDEYPKGFYLRVVDTVPWLRGYRCDDEHVWAPEDRFVFRLPDPSA